MRTRDVQHVPRRVWSGATMWSRSRGRSRQLAPTAAPRITATLLVLCLMSRIQADIPRALLDRWEQDGDFAVAERKLSDELARAELDAARRRELEFERARLDRIRRDYRLTKDDLSAALRKSIEGLTNQEFEDWIHEGRFDGRRIDGTVYYLNASVSNLFFRYPELAARRVPRVDLAAEHRAYLENALAIRRASEEMGRPCVLPKRFRVKMTVTVKPGVVPAGETLHAWLPIPRSYPFQSGFELLAAAPATRDIAPPSSPIRSAHLSQASRGNEETPFVIEYAFTAHGVWFDLDADRVRPKDPADPELRRCIQEAPHIRFTDAMRSLSRELAGGETNTLRLAKRFYCWIADEIRYSYAPEYSTIRDLGDWCLSHRYGDCGQEAFLFMTLCRLNGIPARWQSGWNIFPNAESIHDWCEVYFEPYGWVPVDPYMGIYAMRYATTLAPEQRRQLRDFYFGGLSQYRIAANSDHNQELAPPKRTPRSDIVDFQRGEVETRNRNLYFSEFNYDLKWSEISKEARP